MSFLKFGKNKSFCILHELCNSPLAAVQEKKDYRFDFSEIKVFTLLNYIQDLLKFVSISGNNVLYVLISVLQWY